MKNPKQILLVVVIVILFGALVFLTYLMTNGSSSLGMFNLRASNPQDEVDTFLAENNLAPTQEPAPTNDPSLLAYNSTSPTPTPAVSTSPIPSGTAPSISPTVTVAATKGGLTATLTPTPSPSLTLTSTPTPTEFIVVETSTTPTIVTELPVAGIGNNLNTVLVGAGALILLAFLL
jgi:hypothetical protein